MLTLINKRNILYTGIFILCTAMILSFGNIHPGRAATEEELQARIDSRNQAIKKLEAEIAQYQETLKKTSTESKTLQEKISIIETQIKKLGADIRLTENRITATQLEIEDLSQEIIEKENTIRNRKLLLAETIQAIYERDSISVIEILLKSKQLSDFFGELQEIENLEYSVHNELEDLRNLKTSLEEERQSREGRRTELASLRNELGDRKFIEESTQQEQKVLLTETKNKEVAYQELLEEREEKREAMLDEIQQIEDELRKLIDPTELPNTGSGVLGWPIKGIATLTQDFGNTPDSKILYNGKPHNGIDVAAPVGTPLYAAESGTILEIGNTDAFQGCLSYGKWVAIKHNNNLTTLYAHLSLIKVSKEQSVQRGELIGYSGATGYATGPHLHFTVYDSSTVQFRSSKIAGSKCQFLPYGGYLNPMAYL